MDIIGVQKQTTNIGVLLELGEVPLTIVAQKNAMKDWVRIVNKIQCNSMNINSHEKAVLHNFSWAVRIEITISEIGMWELFLMKDRRITTKV